MLKSDEPLPVLYHLSIGGGTAAMRPVSSSTGGPWTAGEIRRQLTRSMSNKDMLRVEEALAAGFGEGASCSTYEVGTASGLPVRTWRIRRVDLAEALLREACNRLWQILPPCAEAGVPYEYGPERDRALYELRAVRAADMPEAQQWIALGRAQVARLSTAPVPPAPRWRAGRQYVISEVRARRGHVVWLPGEYFTEDAAHEAACRACDPQAAAEADQAVATARAAGYSVSVGAWNFAWCSARRVTDYTPITRREVAP